MCKLMLVFSLLKADPDHVFPKMTPQIIPLILNLCKKTCAWCPFKFFYSFLEFSLGIPAASHSISFFISLLCS